MKLEKLANFQSELTFFVKWSPGITNLFGKYMDIDFSLRRWAGEFTKNILFHAKRQ